MTMYTWAGLLFFFFFLPATLSYTWVFPKADKTKLHKVERELRFQSTYLPPKTSLKQHLASTPLKQSMLGAPVPVGNSQCALPSP